MLFLLRILLLLLLFLFFRFSISRTIGVMIELLRAPHYWQKVMYLADITHDGQSYFFKPWIRHFHRCGAHGSCTCVLLWSGYTTHHVNKTRIRYTMSCFGLWRCPGLRVEGLFWGRVRAANVLEVQVMTCWKCIRNQGRVEEKSIAMMFAWRIASSHTGYVPGVNSFRVRYLAPPAFNRSK
jgi:hypothetical protein